MLETPEEITWCKGCGNFGLLNSFKDAVTELVEEGHIRPEDVVISSGIGCHGKIVDYLNLNSYYSIHGRAVATVTGIKIGNPKLTAIAFQGDGDAFAEGISHLIHAAKRNIDVTVIVHDNGVYGLTTGQFTPTSEKGFKGKSTPEGSLEEPINPLALLLASNCTFVARGFVANRSHLKEIFKKALRHAGFSFVDVLQPCVTFNNTYSHYRENTYLLEDEGHDTGDFDAALAKALEIERIPLGVFYEVTRPAFEMQLLGDLVPAEETGYALASISKILAER